MSEIKFTREELDAMLNDASDGVARGDLWEASSVSDLSATALTLLDRAEKAEKRMQSWECPDSDNICLVCGRDAPCMTEAELKPGDPGIPCTFNMTFQEMIDRVRLYEDRAREAEEESARLTRICDQYAKSHIREVDKRREADRIAAGNLARAEKAERELNKALLELAELWRAFGQADFANPEGDTRPPIVAKALAVRRALERGKG